MGDLYSFPLSLISKTCVSVINIHSIMYRVVTPRSAALLKVLSPVVPVGHGTSTSAARPHASSHLHSVKTSPLISI